MCRGRRAAYLFDLVVLPQQGVRAVGDGHGDHSHGADAHHGHVHVGEDGHDGSAYGEGQRSQGVDDPDAEVRVVQDLLEQG